MKKYLLVNDSSQVKGSLTDIIIIIIIIIIIYAKVKICVLVLFKVQVIGNIVPQEKAASTN